MRSDNSHAKKNCGAAYYVSVSVCFFLILLSMIIFWYIPVSDIANSVDHPAKLGVWLFSVSPVCAVISFVAYLVGGLTDKALVKNSVVQRVIFIVSAVFLFIVAGVTVAALCNQIALGFVAPFAGTVWFKPGVIATVLSIVFFIGNGYIIATAKK